MHVVQALMKIGRYSRPRGCGLIQRKNAIFDIVGRKPSLNVVGVLEALASFQCCWVEERCASFVGQMLAPNGVKRRVSVPFFPTENVLFSDLQNQGEMVGWFMMNEAMLIANFMRSEL